ncbi:Bax inhibitor-1/YccA family protein [Candidatus Chlamydia corallus]|uniref:Bax inhibitor-1/YccA family protein n=1 Tax=Candidatus Chlamydia corallus TaxID=2038470 RepID=UPI000C2FBB75|nr:Bax inhibitor-1 family protein [Candidatus Chlamydia corallus]
MGLYDRDYIQDSRLQGTFASRVYGWMTAGLIVTSCVALCLYFSGLYRSLFSFWWVWCLATLGVSFFINAKIQTLSVSTLGGLFLLYSTLEGMFFGTLLPVYAAQYGGGVIWAAFGSAALVFGLAALYGAFTKSDLTKISKIMTFALIGLLLVTLVFGVVSIFISMPLMYLLICYLGLVIFVGLTAADAQAIRRISASIGNNNALSYKLSLMLALKMYCNVIMVFWYLLQIFSSSGNRD